MFIESKEYSGIGEDCDVDSDVSMFRSENGDSTLEFITWLCGNEFTKNIININFCPFCGRKLNDKYHSDNAE